MKTAAFFLLAILCSFSPVADKPVTDKTEALKAFELINSIRQNPASFTGANLSGVNAMPALNWNDTLAKAAEAKALDMARRNYFSHTDPNGLGMNYHINKAGYSLNQAWLTNTSNNYFESIQAGAADGEEAVSMLIIDNGVPTLGHRKHLLGMDQWNASLKDIGIGFVRTAEGSKFKSYTCILIARHR
ncbi:CAP domain-containing protein [Foetidibacter luteolus]|uniref:CAP domain-containing protein n=1 Tax=Foetidibacter luteolus TaxID=2608880 RepID=UPI00129BC6BF|nr:CAP domain-containing protein [Foetidibacter luteolus]